MFIVFHHWKPPEFSIFFDEQGDKTIGPPQTPFMDEGMGYIAEADLVFFISVGLAFSAWFGLKLWCGKGVVAPDQASASDGFRSREGDR